MNPFDPQAFPGPTLRLFDRSQRRRVDVKGPDRAKFLHNVTTNDVKRLAPGRGCEAFVTSTQGKTLAYVILHARDDLILLRADPSGLDHAQEHLRKYGVFEDTTLDDVSRSTCEFHLIGPTPPNLVPQELAATEYAHATIDIQGLNLTLIRESPTPYPGLTLITAEHHRTKLVTLLQERAGGLIQTCEPAIFDGLRIMAGTPVFGHEVSPANLPQELGRDQRAINFVKGCYLGQETVARLDALGHVNKILTGFRFEPAARPAPGQELRHEGKTVGRLTSVAISPFDGKPVALGYLKPALTQPGTQIELAGEGGACAFVEPLPMPAIPGVSP